MTITGQIGHIGVYKQASMTTEVQLETLDLNSMDKFFVITSDSMAADNGILMAENEIGRGRDRTGAAAGGYAIAGGFGGYGRVADLGYLLQMAMTDQEIAHPSSGAASITPTDYLSWYTIERNIGDTLYQWLVNAKCNTLTITAAANALVTYSVDFVITLEKKIAQSDANTPSYDDDDLLAFYGGLLKLGGTQYNNMESVEVSINNGLSNDEYTVHPSRFLNNVTEGARTFDLNFSQVFQTADDYASYTYGSVARTTPGYALYEDDVYFLLMNALTKATATQWLEFHFPRVMFGGLPVTLTSGRIVVNNTGACLTPAVGEILTVIFH